MRKYCEECSMEVETKVIAKKESYDVCGEKIEVNAQVMVCVVCGEELFCEELDSQTLLSAYSEYRKRHKLLFPEEIRQIREQYGLSQRSFAKLLNWGDKTICRYENGSIQDKAHNSLLLFLREPENMRTYLYENEIMLGEKQKKNVMDRIEMLLENKEYYAGKKITSMFFPKIPNEENGFKLFDYEKLCAMVLYFSHRKKGLLKTKLLKLLNYADMAFYQKEGVSISGARYVHLPYGPVPENFDILFGTMAADHIVHIEVAFDNGYEKHQVIPEREVPEQVLSDEELDIMKQVWNKFADFGSVEISEYSHREKGYMETKQGEIISYEYAKEMQLFG